MRRYISVDEVCVELLGDGVTEIAESFTSLFSRRYLPDPRLADYCSTVDIEVSWIRGTGFKVLATGYYDVLPDKYVVEGAPVEPYVNEAPVFFLIQALARRLALRDRFILTDSVSIHIPRTGRAVLLLGYPHTGKSTISSIAYSKGFTVLSTENTVVEASGSGLRVRAGSSILVFDPRVKELYGVNVSPHYTTRHGYGVLDIGDEKRASLLRDGVEASSIYILHTSFSSSGVSVEQVKGRKIGKLLWYFAVSVLKGLDFYEPVPLNMPLESLENRLLGFLSTIREKYEGRVFEVFGSPLEVFTEIARREGGSL